MNRRERSLIPPFGITSVRAVRPGIWVLSIPRRGTRNAIRTRAGRAKPECRQWFAGSNAYGSPVSVNRRSKGSWAACAIRNNRRSDSWKSYADGREILLEELPPAPALSADEAVRAESIVRRLPDGPSVRSLYNATSIRSSDGQIESFVVTP